MTTAQPATPPLSERIDYIVGQLMERATQPGPNGDPDLELGSLAIALSMIGNVATREISKLTEERDLAVAHDRQPYPTAWAYDRVCAARTKHQERADAADALIARTLAMHKPRTERHGSGCVQCGVVWPCPTHRELSAALPERGEPACGCGQEACELCAPIRHEI